jgi:Protein of unknown function (DUF3276)
MSQQEELFSRMIRAGRRTYFFDVKENRHGGVYLVISERKSSEEGPAEHFRVMVFPEDVQHFTEALGEAVEFLRHYRPSPGAAPTA